MYLIGELADDRKLIDSVLQFQKRGSYTNDQMADFIGCTRQTYGKVRNAGLNGEIAASPTFLWSAMQFLRGKGNKNGGRSSAIERKTSETNISLELNIDGSGQYEVNTGISMFDHLLSQVARHGVFDIKLTAAGDDQHHLVEDVAICLGKALGEALGEKRGIVRMADATVPMDDALAMVAVDISGRGYTVLELPFTDNDMAGFPTDLIRHFLESFAIEARLNLHARVAYGTNDHHKAEALFKALGRALDMATIIDDRISGELPSTKGSF